MHNTNFPEATWLADEILKLSIDCGINEDSRERLRKISEDLAEAVLIQGETCIQIKNTDDISFLTESCGNGIVSENEKENTPLVFDYITSKKHPTLYFRRQYFEEIKITEKILELTSCPKTPISEKIEKIICAGEAEGFPFPLNEEQQTAVRKIVSNKYVLISGGPGTGKTTLLMRAMICLLTQNPDVKIAIAAPTGKAAARIRESISQQILNPKNNYKSFDDKLQKLPIQTIHKLLNINPWNPTERKEITADAVVIDEASMISQTLMFTLLSAIHGNTKLILLGDKNQLDSVDAGHVFGDLCSTGTLKNSKAELTISQRFNSKKFLGKLSTSVLEKDIYEIHEVLSNPPEGMKICKIEDDKTHRDELLKIIEGTLPQSLKNIPEDAEPKTILEDLESSRILSPMQAGPFGVDAINKLARKIFAPLSPGKLFHGQPILVRQNSEIHNLSNGDVGIILRSRDTLKFEAWFFKSGELKKIPATFLPDFETAYAMTIHKSQGSEFSRLAVVLPQTSMPDFYSSQLLYTAITRFKEKGDSKFSFIYSEAALVSCIRNTKTSPSLLRERAEKLA